MEQQTPETVRHLAFTSYGPGTVPPSESHAVSFHPSSTSPAARLTRQLTAAFNSLISLCPIINAKDARDGAEVTHIDSLSDFQLFPGLLTGFTDPLASLVGHGGSCKQLRQVSMKTHFRLIIMLIFSSWEVYFQPPLWLQLHKDRLVVPGF